MNGNMRIQTGTWHNEYITLTYIYKLEYDTDEYRTAGSVEYARTRNMVCLNNCLDEHIKWYLGINENMI